MDPFNFSILVNGHEAPSKTSTSNADDISETNPSQIGLLQKRPSDFSNPDIKYPSFYESLSEKSKDEFKNLWNLAQSIQSNANAHKSQFDNSKRFITTGPLQLNSFISEVKGKRIAFSLENFLKESNISLKEALLVNAKLNNAKLNHAKLNNAKLNHAQLNDAKLNCAQLNFAELNGAQLNGAQLNYAELNNAQLNHAQLNYAELNDAQLNNAQLNGAKLNYALLNNAQLNGAKLNGAELNYAELIGAQLIDAQLNDAELNGAQLIDAQLNDAQLIDAQLNDAQLDYAELNNIQISFDTQFNKDTELKNIRLDSLSYTDKAGKVTQYTDQEQIRDLFVRLGANSNNISFASAA